MPQINTSELEQMFVTEVGIRQAWLFVNFCNNTDEKAKEYRLYIDTDFKVEPDVKTESSDIDIKSISKLLILNNSTVQKTTVSPSSELTITFEGGKTLTVSGTPNSKTSHDVWWISSVS